MLFRRRSADDFAEEIRCPAHDGVVAKRLGSSLKAVRGGGRGQEKVVLSSAASWERGLRQFDTSTRLRMLPGAAI